MPEASNSFLGFLSSEEESNGRSNGETGEKSQTDPPSHLHLRNIGAPRGHAGSLERNVSFTGLSNILH